MFRRAYRTESGECYVMRIAATDPSLHPPTGLSIAHPTNQRGRSPHAIPNDDGQTKKTASVPLVADAGATPVEPRESNESESRGVMRLLEANHFRGVAVIQYVKSNRKPAASRNLKKPRLIIIKTPKHKIRILPFLENISFKSCFF